MAGLERGYCGACLYWKNLEELEEKDQEELSQSTTEAGLMRGQCTFVSQNSQQYIVESPFPEVRSGTGEPKFVPIEFHPTEDMLCQILLLGGLWAYEIPFTPE